RKRLLVPYSQNYFCRPLRKYIMTKKYRKRSLPSELIRININDLVNKTGYWEALVDKYHISLIPQKHVLALFVNHIRTDKTWPLSSKLHWGYLRQGNRVELYEGNDVWYVHGSDGARYRDLYIHPQTHQIGTRREMNIAYRRKRVPCFREEAKKLELELFRPRDDEWMAEYERRKKQYRIVFAQMKRG